MRKVIFALVCCLVVATSCTKDDSSTEVDSNNLTEFVNKLAAITGTPLTDKQIKSITNIVPKAGSRYLCTADGVDLHVDTDSGNLITTYYPPCPCAPQVFTYAYDDFMNEAAYDTWINNFCGW
jgi:hypothetical protein